MSAIKRSNSTPTKRRIPIKEKRWKTKYPDKHRSWRQNFTDERESHER